MDNQIQKSITTKRSFSRLKNENGNCFATFNWNFVANYNIINPIANPTQVKQLQSLEHN